MIKANRIKTHVFIPRTYTLLENLLYLQRFHFFIFSVGLLQQIYNKKVKYPSKYNVKMGCLLLSDPVQSVALFPVTVAWKDNLMFKGEEKSKRVAF